MRWFRTSKNSGLLALAALALQVVLSFGHVHFDGVHRDSKVSASSSMPASPSPPAQPRDDNDDYCPICASIYLAGNSFVPQAPQLPVPIVSQVVEHFDRIAVIFVVLRRAPFQSRPPPLS
jgi:hypothetical protein